MSDQTQPPVWVTNVPVLLVSELDALGITKSQRYTKYAQRTLHGHAVKPGHDPDSFTIRLRSLRLLMRPGRFVSRTTAARAYGVPVWREGQPLEAGAIRPEKPPAHKQVLGHQIEHRALRHLPREPRWLPHPADVWGLLAAKHSLESLVIAGDFLISGKNRYTQPLCSKEDLEQTLLAFQGCAGVTRLRTALDLITTGVESPAESALRLLIVRAGLPVPLACCPVPTSERVFHADLGYPELRIAIEYEGAYHFEGGVEQARRDLDRAEAMQDAGWLVLRVTAIDLRDPERFLARLARALRRACAGTTAKRSRAER